MISTICQEILTTAQAKALATAGEHGVNVVPVSMIKVHADSIWLFDFFMEKTADHLRQQSPVALTAWTDMKGIQVKGDVTYHTDGDDFATAVAWVHTQNPSRVLKGLIIITPTAIFDISPGVALTPQDLSL
jgi:predicted pyridoxine 5'-phosphate oxidase superfamily flavin-nucleotide-binding protein